MASRPSPSTNSDLDGQVVDVALLGALTDDEAFSALCVPSGWREQICVGLDAATQNLELDVPIRIPGDNPGNLRVGIVVADDHVATRGQLNTGPSVGRLNP